VNSSKGGLIGVLVIIMVLSTLFVLSLRREEVGSPVYLAKNEYPDIFQSTEARGEPMIFNFGIICKESFKELEVRYANLFMTPEPEFTDPTFVPNTSDPVTIMESRKDIRTIKNSLGDITIPFDVINVSVSVGNRTHSQEFSGVIYDFARTLGLFLEPNILDQIFEVYAILKSEDNEILYFAGVPDFFYERNRNIKYLSIHHNQNESTYEAVSDLPVPDLVPVDQAPRVGSILFKETEKDDQIFVQMNVESILRSLPEVIEQPALRRYMVEYIRVYANGNLEVSETNVIPIESGGWQV
jgi:hypothetical protein